MRVGIGTKWLVKSNGRVMGPYTERQVSDLLRNKVLVPLDEVSQPCGRWRYFRDEPSFARVVEEVRVKNMQGLFEESTTRLEDADGNTQTVSSHQANDELTAEISQAVMNEITNVQDVSFYSMDDPKIQSTIHSDKVYTFVNDKNLDKQSSRAARGAWLLTAVIIFSAICFVFYSRYIKKPHADKVFIAQNTQMGISSLDRGDYKEALSLFERSVEVSPSESSLFLYLGLLKTQIANQPLQARKYLEQLVNKKNQDMRKVYIGIGLTYLVEKDLDLAESFFNKALDVDPIYSIASIDLGAAAILREDWARANNHLLLALKDGSHEGPEVIMLIDSFFHQFEKDNDIRFLEEIIKSVDEFTSKSKNFAFESRIGKIYALTLLNKKGESLKELSGLLDSDFKVTDNSRQNLFVYQGASGWNIIGSWCSKLATRFDLNPRVTALEGFCLMKNGQITEANSKLNDALAQAPADTLVLSTAAVVYREMNLQSSFMAATKKAFDLNVSDQYIGPLRLMAESCRLNYDSECQVKAWNRILKKDKTDLVSLAGLSRFKFQSGDLLEAKQHLSEGLRIHPNFIPFIELSQIYSAAEGHASERGP